MQPQKPVLKTQRFYLLTAVLVMTGLAAVTSAIFQTQVSAQAPSMTGRVDGWVQQAKLTAQSGLCGDDFGYSVALSQDGSTAVVGAYGTDGAASDSGAAYIFVRNGTSWSQQAKLTSSSAAGFDAAGFSVAISADGDTVLVGAYQRDASAGKDVGAGYVFIRSGTTWTQQTKLSAGDGATGDEFGYAVALSGETALIGAPLDDDAGVDSGSAYVFTRSGTTWTQQAKLLPSGGSSLERFGQSVALDTNTAVIGAPFADKGTAFDAGMAVVFTRSGTTWTQQAKLKVKDAAAGDQLGFAVAVSGNSALLGAVGVNNSGINAGAVYAFTRSGTTWSQQAKLTPTDANPNHQFGVSVALVGDSALIGAPGDDEAAEQAGAAYRFVRTSGTWSQNQKILSGDANAQEQFGNAVALAADGSTAFVGAFLEGGIGSAFGAAYTFSMSANIPTATPVISNTPTVPPTATPTPLEPSVTPMPGEELLLNGDFETDSNLDKLPDNWLLVNPTGDKLKCNSIEKLVAQAGECAFRFKGSIGESSKLQQDVILTVSPVAGDTLYLSGFANLTGAPSLKVMVRVTYVDTNLPDEKIVVKYNAATGGYQPFSGQLALVLAGEPSQIRVMLKNRAASGKSHIDTLSLKWQAAGTIMGGRIPLP